MELFTHARDTELVIGLVAPVGVNLDDVHNRLESFFTQFRYKVNFIQLSRLAKKYIPQSEESLTELQRLDEGMNHGLEIRKKYSRPDFYALLAIEAINKMRETGANESPPLKRYVHIIRSLKHPAEVETLRHVYGDGFFLLGISSSIARRKYYLEKLKGVSTEELDRLIERDDKEPGDWGQRTRDVFQLADAFVSADYVDNLSEQLSRILDLLFSSPVISPTADEYAMFLAYAASLRSADLSRQVGAVISNQHNDIISTGANDVPRAGGGLYWPGDDDERDFVKGYDTNEKEKREILLKVMKQFPESHDKDDKTLLELGMKYFKDTGLLNITEYGRAVHAEMEAILSAGRNGVSVRGATLYSTTYPCHNCAKHIVASGLSTVKYIEPYPKSYAIKLHSDSIEASGETAQDKVHFEPFVGVGPRRFVDLFSMALSSGRNIERKRDGNLVEWKRENAELRVPLRPLSYLEAEVAAVVKLEETTKGV